MSRVISAFILGAFISSGLVGAAREISESYLITHGYEYKNFGFLDNRWVRTK